MPQRPTKPAAPKLAVREDESPWTKSELSEVRAELVAAVAELNSRLNRWETIKDFRVLACLPLERLRTRTLVQLRVDYMGRLLVETVTGEDVKSDEPKYLWTVLSRGHMRLVVPPASLDQRAWLAKRAGQGGGGRKGGGDAAAAAGPAAG